jgi:hypothetical protein
MLEVKLAVTVALKVRAAARRLDRAVELPAAGAVERRSDSAARARPDRAAEGSAHGPTDPGPDRAAERRPDKAAEAPAETAAESNGKAM